MHAILKSVDVIDDQATGAKMRALRESSNVSLRELGQHLELSAAYLSDLELGRRGWTEERAAQYVDALTPKRKRDAVPTRRTMK